MLGIWMLGIWMLGIWMPWTVYGLYPESSLETNSRISNAALGDLSWAAVPAGPVLQR
jgi:hypothetical protein